MNIIKRIKNWFSKNKRKKTIFNEIKKSTETLKPTNKRLKEVSNRIDRGVEILNYLEKSDKKNINKFNNEKLVWDLRSLIEKHFSNENKILKEEIRYLNNLIETKDNKINRLYDDINKLNNKTKKNIFK